MTFPDVVALLIDYLTDSLAGAAPVASRVPAESQPRPPLVEVRRVGGAAAPPVRDQARLDVFCWHDTDPEAMTLALTVRRHIWALAGTSRLGPPVYQVAEFLGPRQADDPVTGIPRVWATYTLTVRADDVIHVAPDAFAPKP